MTLGLRLADVLDVLMNSGRASRAAPMLPAAPAQWRSGGLLRTGHGVDLPE